MESVPNQDSEDLIVEINGMSCRKINTGYTVRQYFSHLTPEKGPGPGWDTREYILEKYGVAEPKDLPDEPYFVYEEVE